MPRSLPEGWTSRRVGDAFEMQLGKMLSEEASAGPNQAPYLANRHVQWGRVVLDSLDTMSFNASERMKFSLEPGDLLVCEGGEVGRTALWRGEGDEVFFQKAIHRLRPTNGQVEPGFMLRFMRFAADRGLFTDLSSQTSIAHLTQEKLALLTVPTPPNPEQRQIAEILDTVDEAIRKTEEIIAKLQQVKQGLLHDLLTRGIDDNGELRDPDRHPEQFKDSPLGRIPKAWRVGRVAEVGTWASGGTPSKGAAAFWNGSIPWASPKDMKVFRLSDTQDRVSEEGVAAGSRLVPTGSVLIVVRGMILAHTFPVCLTGRSMAFNQDVKAIVPRDGLLGEYLAYWFVANADLMLSLVTESTHGTKRIDLVDLHRQLIAAPLTREQEAILEVMRAEEERLDHELSQLSKLHLLKQGLMEDLLTGRVRVTAILEEAAQ